MIARAPQTFRGRLWSLGGAAIGVLSLVWVLTTLDYDRLASVAGGARAEFLALVPLAIVAEQLVRGWKWRQILHALRPIATLRLFGAIMAGYLAGMFVPGGSPLMRSWLVARLERLRMSAMLATVVIDRLIDGIVFAILVGAVLAVAVFPDPSGDIQRGLWIAGLGSLLIFVLLLAALYLNRQRFDQAAGWVLRVVHLMPRRFAERAQGLLRSFAQGIVWPGSHWRGAAIVLASLLMKLISATHFLWAGLSIGVLLRPVDYLFVIVFLGFIVIAAHIARIPGGFLLGAIFVLGLFGVDREQALAMALVVQVASSLSVVSFGGLALWWNGVTLDELSIASTKQNDEAR